MILSIEGGVKIYRRNLEAELEKEIAAEKKEEIKKLLAMSDEELAEILKGKNADKEISEDQLESVSGG